jgi:hypothetical protein
MWIALEPLPGHIPVWKWWIGGQRLSIKPPESYIPAVSETTPQRPYAYNSKRDAVTRSNSERHG